jgi:cobalt-zinc-cadmium efflux system outer membrane protein
VPDVEVNAGLFKEHTIFPLQNYFQITLSVPVPFFDRNQGNIRAASAALVRAAEQPHAVEVSLTTGLAMAYATYKNNLASVEYYRANILPDQVRYYRGVFERRKVDPGAAFGDLVQAQQTLVTDVTSYLGILNSLWTSVVNVADYLQTDDLFQLGGTLELPQLPDFDELHPLPCPHPEWSKREAGDQPTPAPVPNAEATTPPATTTTPSKVGRRIARPSTMGAADLFADAADPGRSAGHPEPGLPVLESPFGAPGPASELPIAQASRMFSPGLSRRLSTASL